MNNQAKLLSIIMQTGLPKAGVSKPEAIPFALIGPPGTAKTAVVTEIANELSTELDKPFPAETLALPQTMPESLGGCPVPNWDDKVMELFVLRVGAQLKRAQQGVLFLDELTSAPAPVGAAAQTVIQNGKLGDFQLPSSVSRGVAMNDPETATAARPLSSAESNRFCWIPWELDVVSWTNYMLGGKGLAANVTVLPDNWERIHYRFAASLVTHYCRRMPKDLLREPPVHDATQPWPSPRSWRNAARLIAACKSVGEPIGSELTTAAISGCVGEDVTLKFLDFVRNLDIPDPEEVLKDPENYPLPERDDKLLAAVNAVATAGCDTRYNGEEFNKRWRAACTVCERFPNKKDTIMSAAVFLLGHHPGGDEPLPKLGQWYRDLMSSIGR